MPHIFQIVNCIHFSCQLLFNHRNPSKTFIIGPGGTPALTFVHCIVLYSVKFSVPSLALSEWLGFCTNVHINSKMTFINHFGYQV